MSENESLIGHVAEHAVIGALLRYPDDPVVAQILAATEVDDFEIPACRAIRYAAQGLTDGPFDLQTIALKLEQTGELGSTVTTDFLRDSFENAPLPVTIDQHIEALKSYRASRQIHSNARALLQGLETSHGDPGMLAQLVETTMVDINDCMVGIGSQGWTTIAESGSDLINKDHTGPSEYISTGLDNLDEALGGGLGLGTVTTIAARPGFGKSALSLDILRTAALGGIPSLAFSLEMGAEEVTSRFLGASAKIGHRALRNGLYTEAEKKRLLDWEQKLRSIPAYLDTRDTIGPQEVISTFARLNADAKMKFGTGIKLVVFDYLQLMTTQRRFPSRQEEVAYYMRELTKFTKRENVATVLVAQLNRGDKQRNVESRPTVKDLRESGSIEQDSDVVLLLAKPEEDEIVEPRGEMDIIIGKNRNGPLMDVPVTFMAHYPTFVERDPVESQSSGEEW